MSYESDILRDWYLLFHYGSAEEILHGVGFDVSALPLRCLEFPVTTVEAGGIVGKADRALDLGCAVGRSTLELSRHAEEVIGIDFSSGFVGVAEKIRRGEGIEYRRYSEMHIPESLVARIPEGMEPDRVSFEVGDAMALRENIGSFDFVHAANLLCRLPEPKLLLDRLPHLVAPGGRLVMATPATWLAEYTPPGNHPPGLTLDYLKKGLGDSFEFISVKEIPFLIREHRRKLQLSTSQTSLWIRK